MNDTLRDRAQAAADTFRTTTSTRGHMRRREELIAKENAAGEAVAATRHRIEDARKILQRPTYEVPAEDRAAATELAEVCAAAEQAIKEAAAEIKKLEDYDPRILEWVEDEARLENEEFDKEVRRNVARAGDICERYQKNMILWRIVLRLEEELKRAWRESLEDAKAKYDPLPSLDKPSQEILQDLCAELDNAFRENTLHPKHIRELIDEINALSRRPDIKTTPLTSWLGYLNWFLHNFRKKAEPALERATQLAQDAEIDPFFQGTLQEQPDLEHLKGVLLSRLTYDWEDSHKLVVDSGSETVSRLQKEGFFQELTEIMRRPNPETLVRAQSR